MKGQNSNRIIPIRSLLQNVKQEGKKPYPQLDIKNITPNLTENNVTPRIREQSPFLVSHRHHPSNDPVASGHSKDHKKGISLNKHAEKNGSEQRISIQSLPGDQVYTFASSKKERNHFAVTSDYPIFPQQPFKSDFSVGNYYNKSKKLEQVFSQHSRLETKPQNNEAKKNAETPKRIFEDLEKESTTLTDKYNSKCEEETRYVSKYQKMQSHPIFKDETTKIKTELFHKQALLFQRTQEVEQKDKVIAFLQNKIQMNGNINENAKKIVAKERQLLEIGEGWRKKCEYQEKMASVCSEKLKIAEEKIKHQAECIETLRKRLSNDREQFKKYEADNNTNYALINLKLRQYEAEEKEKYHDLAQFKEKQKKVQEHQEKIIKALSELLRQKEEIIAQITSSSLVNTQQLEKIQNIIQEKQKKFNEQLENKESFIRELSAEVGDLKESLRNMEMRIREMIEQQEELKKENQEKEKRCKALLISKDDLSEQIRRYEKASSLSISKGKEQFNEANLSELKSKIGQLNEIIFRRESSLIAYKQKNNDLQERLKKLTSVNKSAPSKVQPTKATKDNEKLAAVIKDLNTKLSRSIKLNEQLNEEVAKRQLIMLNNKFSSQFQEQIQ